jgi:hypothetical protein
VDLVEKARVRMSHWLAHNETHQEEYAKLAAELEGAGKRASSREIREMVELSRRSDECLRKALAALEQ